MKVIEYLVLCKTDSEPWHATGTNNLTLEDARSTVEAWNELVKKEPEFQ